MLRTVKAIFPTCLEKKLSSVGGGLTVVWLPTDWLVLKFRRRTVVATLRLPALACCNTRHCGSDRKDADCRDDNEALHILSLLIRKHDGKRNSVENMS